MSEKTGGPAFPCLYVKHERGEVGNNVPIKEYGEGVTLRDYFAAKVLPTMISDGAALEAVKMIAKKTGTDAFEVTAKTCYAYADAMLAERAK